MVWFRTVPRTDSVHLIRVSRVFFDPADARARWLRRSAGVTQPAVTWLCCQLVARVRPTVAIDVGANYGDVALSTRYPPGARVLLVEANPSLIPHLRRSCSTHVNASALVVEGCFASDSNGEVTLVVDEKWSGTSSSVMPVVDSPFKGTGEQSHRDVLVPTRTIGQLLERLAPERDGSLIAKIDVEGAEPKVLAGMRHTLEKRNDWAVLLECNQDHLRRGGIAEADYLQTLRSLGEVRLLRGTGSLAPLRNLAEVPERGGDLLVTSRTARMAGIAESLRSPAPGPAIFRPTVS